MEYTGVPESGPGFISIGVQKSTKSPTGGGNIPVPPPPDLDFDSIMLIPTDANAVTTNVAGTATSLYTLSSANAAITTKAVSYPGGASDDNNTQWEVPVPSNMDNDNPTIIVRLHILIPV